MSNTAETLFSELSGRGVTLRAAPDGTLRCKPTSKLTQRDALRLKTHKRELLSLLASIDESNISSPPSPTTTKPDTYGGTIGDDAGDDTGEGTVPTFVKERQERSQKLGLVARWSYEFGFISLHDPTTGEWYDVPTKEAPDWATKECFKRRDLRKERGITRLLTRAEMEEVWEKDKAEMWEHPTVDKRGLVYEDYLDDERS